jgi:primosomal protein N' (replication factor Y)
MKTRRDLAVQPLVREWLARTEIDRAARVDVDIDPVSFM